jgi:cyclomaltodextrinase
MICCEPYGVHAYPLGLHTVSITLQAKSGDLKSCYLVHRDPWEADVRMYTVKMNKVATDYFFDYFRIVLNVPSRRIRYLFLLDNGRERLWYSEAGLTLKKPEVGELGLPYFEISNVRKDDVLIVPEWAKGVVAYQIFPDRFYNEDKTNDPPNTKEWGKLPLTRDTFYGGDLHGIIKKIPYLSELGVDLIYLTPVFSSPSTHKYDTTDYYQIDPHFGNLKTFKELVKKCHENSIKVILDGVFDHCGHNFWAFQDVVEKGPKSKYVNWFNIYSFPIKTRPKPTYQTWGKDIWWMPRLMTENPEVRQYLLKVAVYWIKEAGIDGWRLDVANELGHDFLREFRKAVKKANPDAIIIGEIPHFASPWLEGEQCDSVMNYYFRLAVIDFFAKGVINTKEFDARLAKIRMVYKEPVNHVLYNLIGSHDTLRFLSLPGNKIEKMMLAIIFQFTYLGMPVVYYGDERGMVGGSDPDCRRCMDWGKLKGKKLKLFELYKKLISLRKSHPALKTGEFSTHFVDRRGNLYSYLRRSESQEILIALNNSAKTRMVAIPSPKGWNGTVIDLLEGGKYEIVKGKIRASLRPYSGLVLKTA